MTSTTLSRTVVEVTIRGLDAIVEARHETDDLGAHTVIEVIDAEDGAPIYPADLMAEGHLTAGEVWAVARDLAHGLSTPRCAWWAA